MTHAPVKNEEAFKRAIALRPGFADEEVEPLRSLVALYESFLTGKKDAFGNDTAINLAVKAHPIWSKKSGAGYRTIYNFLAEYEHITRPTDEK